MKCRLIAAGTRLPDWVNEGFRDYQKRLRSPLVLDLVEIPVATRRPGKTPIVPLPGRARTCSLR